jgi:predicted helicase
MEAKFRKGYPQDNIVFEDSTQAVLIQHRQKVMRCDVTDVAQLEKLLKLFFAYERSEIADFRKAVEQFKTDLPAVLAALKHVQEAINPTLTDADVREMLIQHVLTEEIFAKVFDDSEFHRKYNVAHELYELEETFFTRGLKKATLKVLEPYHAAIRRSASSTCWPVWCGSASRRCASSRP